jgi:autotransporter-associated beta strand protein
LIGGAATTFSTASVTTINTGGTVDLGGFAQTINTVSLAGGTLQNGALTSSSGIASTGGTINGIGGSTAVTTTAGTTTLQGANSYAGATNVSGGTLIGAAANTFSAASATTITGGGTVDLGGFAQTINTLSLAGGTVQNGALASTNGVASTGGTINNIGGSTAVTTTAGTTTLQGSNGYTGATTVSGGTLLGAAPTTFRAASATTINTGGIADLGGFAQTINTVNLAGGAIQNGALTSANGIASTGGAISNIAGSTGVTALAGTTTLLGTNGYTGATKVGGGTLIGGAAAAFSAASATTINSGGTVDLGGFAQTIKTVNLAGGTVQNGALTSANGIASIGGTINTIAGPTAVTTTAGTTTLKGTNGYAGATTVSGGTLIGGAASTFSAASATTINSGGTVDLGSAAQTIATLSLAGGTLQNGTLTSTNGIASAGGTINAVGGTTTLTLSSGTTALMGANTFTGATTVNGGALLSVSGSSSTSAVTVNSTGLLAGLGSVGDVTINNGGTLMAGVGALTQGLATSPTATPQTLAVTGSLVMATASTYMVTINGSNFTSTSVAGTATISSGALLKISGTNLLLNTPYNILTATTVATGTPIFASTTVTPTTTYHNAVTNTGKALQLTFTNPQLNPGVLPPGFASFVNVVNNSPSNSPLQHLFGLSPGSLQNAASQLSGQSNSGGSTSIANMQTSFSTALLNPNLGNRGGATGAFGPALGFAPETPLTPQEQAAYDAVTPHEPLDALMRSLNTDYSHSVWASGYGGYSRITGDSNIGSPTATTGGGGVASGIDFRFGRDTVVGVALGGGDTSWSMSDGLGGGTSQIFQAGVYGSHRFGEAYVSGSFAYAFDWLHTNRNVTVPTTANLTANFVANGPTGRLETGYRFGGPELAVTPYIAGEFSALHTPSYGETTASGTPGLALSYDSQTTTNVRAELGAWADKAFHLADGSTLWLRGRAGYAHDWWSNNTLSAQFLSLPTQSFTMTNIASPANLGLVSLMAEIKYRNGVSLSAKFDSELGQSAYSVAGTGTFRYSW